MRMTKMKYSVFTTVVALKPSLTSKDVEDIRKELGVSPDAHINVERDRVTFQYSVSIPKYEEIIKKAYKTAYPGQKLTGYQ
jgi:hypothetical protein